MAGHQTITRSWVQCLGHFYSPGLLASLQARSQWVELAATDFYGSFRTSLWISIGILIVSAGVVVGAGMAGRRAPA